MAAVHYDSDDTHYQWNEYDEFEEGHLAYDLADDLDEEHLAAITSLTLKDSNTMKANEMRQIFRDHGVSLPKTNKKSELQNHLLAARETCRERVQALLNAMPPPSPTEADH